MWSPLAAGLLTGAYRRGQAAPEDGRHLAGWDEPPVHEEALYDIIKALVAIGEDHGVSAAQVSLAWSMNRPGVASLVIGARNDAQLLTTWLRSNWSCRPRRLPGWARSATRR